MDTLQTQINTLHGKVDTLHQLIEQLTLNLSQVIGEIRLMPNANGNPRSPFMSPAGRYTNTSRSGDQSMEHKDVLVDHTDLDSMSHSGEKALSPEVQIQRLTAQLTAAYNRIAALEEQLLAQRIH
jgi:hypothetical protein